MYCLTSTCYVCLKPKDKSLVNINSSLSVNKDILHILGYLPCNLAWLKTKALVLICEECCVRLRETYLFLAMCLTNSAVLRGYMAKLNTACGSDADNEAELRADFNTEQNENSKIKLEPEATLTEETVDALVNVEEPWVQTFSSIKIEDPCEEDDDNEESLIVNNSTGSGSGQVHQQYQSSGESGLVQGKTHKKLDNSVNRNEDTSGGSTVVKKNKKETGNSAGKECAVVETAGKSVKEILPKKTYKRYLKDLAEYKRWMNPQEQQEQQQQQEEQLQQQQEERRQQRQLQRQQRKLLKKFHRKQRKLQKPKKRAFRHLLSCANLHGNSTYEDFAKEYGQDERFKGVVTWTSPEDLFQAHVNRLRKREMEAEELLQEQEQQEEQQLQQQEEQQQPQKQQEQQQLEQQLQQEQQQWEQEQEKQRRQGQRQLRKQQRKLLQEQRKLESKKDNFRKLLSQINLHGNSTYEDFAKEYGQDERFKKAATGVSPEYLFQKYVSKLRKRERKAEKLLRRDQVTSMNTDQQQGQEQQEEQQQQQQQEEQQQQERPRKALQQQRARFKKHKVVFRELLAEAQLHYNSTYSAFEQAYGQDERFQNVFKHSSRATIFSEHICALRRRQVEAEIEHCDQVTDQP